MLSILKQEHKLFFCQQDTIIFQTNFESNFDLCGKNFGHNLQYVYHHRGQCIIKRYRSLSFGILVFIILARCYLSIVVWCHLSTRNKLFTLNIEITSENLIFFSLNLYIHKATRLYESLF